VIVIRNVWQRERGGVPTLPFNGERIPSFERKIDCWLEYVEKEILKGVYSDT
jgi:hypothetical protein